MPTLVIPRSKSAPDITSPDSPYPPPTDNSIRSTRSTGSPITLWPKKLNDLITSKTMNSTLTAEALQEFNRRTALETRNASSSPYYKGLTDFSLVINREKLSSPGRESQATTSVSSGSRTSFVGKVHEWGSSCFTSKNQEKSSSSSTKNLLPGTTVSGPAVTKIRTKTTKIESEPERKKVVFSSLESEDAIIFSSEKPLRERDFEPPPVQAIPPLIIPTLDQLPLTLPQAPLQPSPKTPKSPLLPPPRTPKSPLPPPPSPPQECHTCPPLDTQDPPTRIPAAGFLKDNRETNTTENERKYAWADKYRPFWLHDFLCNKGTALMLKTMVRSWDGKQLKCGHFIFEGNPGVGKRTMIWALLREAFGPDGTQAKEESKEFYLKGEGVSSIPVKMMVSDHHIEVNLSELKGYEKHVIVELIKANNETLSKTTPQKMNNCKAIVLYDVDRLSVDGLSYIKWMLEKFKGNNKIFFCCSDSSKLQAIKPLSTHVHLLEPSNKEILDVLAYVAEKEGIELPQKLATEIANKAKNNLRQAIRSFEATWQSNGCRASLKEDQDIKTGWEDKIAKIASNIIEEQSPKQLYHIRGELQNLIEHNVAPEFIFQTLNTELKKILSEQLKPQLDNLYDEYQQNHGIKYLAHTHNQEELGKSQNDQKKNVQQFMRIEEFIARFMSWYKGLVTKNNEVEEMLQNEVT